MVEKIRLALLTALLDFLPCERNPAEVGGGDAAASIEDPPGGDAAQVVADADDRDARLLAQAQQLEKANSTIEELQAERANFDQRVQERATEMLFDVMPEAYEPQMPAQPGPPQPGFQHTPPAQPGQEYYLPTDAVEGDDPGRGPDPAIAGQIQEQNARLQAIEDAQFARNLDDRLNGIQQKYPNMDRMRVMTYLANLGERADQVNIERLCEISHTKETTRLNNYAENYHREQLAKMQQGGQPPTVPGQGQGAPNEGVKITRQNAAQIFEERARARGWFK